MEKESFFSEDDPFFDDDTREKIKDIADALRKEKPKKEIIQRSRYVGYFCPLVKAGDQVRKGQKIGFIRIPGAKKEEEETIEAQAGGVIKEILPTTETGFNPVEYGQTLFIIEQG